MEEQNKRVIFSLDREGIGKAMEEANKLGISSDEVQQTLKKFPENVSEPRIINREEVPMENVKPASTIEIVHSILDQAKHEVGDRADTYDQEEGEESMPRIVAMFNVLYGCNMSVEQGWMFMTLLKQVRSSQGSKKMDNYVDLAAYAAFAGKAASDEKG